MLRYNIFFLIFLMFLGIPSELSAQIYTHNLTLLGPELGLDGQIKHIYHQDKYGFLWMASTYGLDRYDGKEVLNCKAVEDISKDNLVTRYHECRDSMLWILTSEPGYNFSSQERKIYHSLYIINPLYGTSIPLDEYFPKGLPFEINEISSTYQSGELIYFITISNEIYQYENSFEKIGNFPLEITNNNRWIINRKKELIVAQESFIKVYSLNGTLKKRVAFNKGVIVRIIESFDNTYQLLFQNKGIHLNCLLLDERFQIIAEFAQDREGLPFITKRPDGNYCLVHEGMIDIVDKEFNTLSNISPFTQANRAKNIFNYNFPIFFNNSSLVALSSAEGPTVLQSTISPFQNFLNYSDSKYSTRGICTDPEGKIYVSARSNLIEIEPTTKTVNEYINPIDVQSIYLTPCSTVYDNETDLIWQNYKLHISSFDPKSKSYTNYFGEFANNLLFTKIVRLKATKELLVFTNEGIITLDANCNCLKKKILGSKDSKINLEAVIDFKEWEDKVWFLSHDAIYEWEYTTNSIVSIHELPNSATKKDILDFEFQGKNTLWIATSGDGIFKYNLQTKSTEHITKQQGLSSDIVYSVQFGADGLLWLSTAYGLNALDLKDQSVKVFLPEDGIANFEHNTASFHQDEKGNLYFGGLNGITKFHPNDISSLSAPEPKTYITSAIIHNVKDSSSYELPLKNITSITLASNELLTLGFSSPNVGHKPTLKYQYKFDEHASPWQTLASSKLSLSNIKPGPHLLKIRGTGNRKEWSENEASITIFVPTPFFQSAWFYISLGAIILALGYFYARYRIYSLQQSRIRLQQEVEKRTLSITKSKEVIEKQAEELKDLDKLKSKFFTNISHELRTPLTLMLNPLKELRKMAFQTNIQKEFVETAFSASSQLSSMVERILQLSELDAKKIQVNESLISIPMIIEQIIIPFKEQANALGISFSVSKNDLDSEHVFLDVDKLKDILENLILNAIKFSPEGGAIHIAFSHEDGELSVICKDEGLGISASDQEQLFTRYFQTADTNLPAQGGLGIGLTLSMEFARLMGGDLTIDSIEGKGTSVLLKLPCKIFDEEITTGIKKEYFDTTRKMEFLKEHGEQQNPTLLVIEDHQMMNVLLGNLLRHDFHILTARNGKEGIELLEKNYKDIDLIISDWMMPIMDGPSVMKKVRAHPEWKFIPLIMLTARASREDRISAFRIGVDDYLSKPFDKDELITRVYNLLNNSKERIKANTIVETEGKAVHQINPEFSAEPSADDLWLKNLEEIVLEKMASRNFSVTELAESVNLGERQLTRRLKALTGLTPGNYIKECRLLKAEHYLKHKKYRSVAEVCYAVGFSTPDYFTKIYFNRFGLKPSSYFK